MRTETSHSIKSLTTSLTLIGTNVWLSRVSSTTGISVSFLRIFSNQVCIDIQSSTAAGIDLLKGVRNKFISILREINKCKRCGESANSSMKSKLEKH